MLALKVVTTLLIGGTLAFAPDPRAPRVALLALGVLLSAAGDAFLLDSDRYFLAGLVAFLAAHLTYVAAFWSAPWLAPVAGIVVVGAVGFVALLWPGLGKMRVPVLVYMAAIATMVTKAWGAGPLAGLGATVFMVSDGILGYDRFRRPVPRRDLAVMLPYWLGQVGIVLAAHVA